MTFIDYIENLYESLNIYRAIIVTNINVDLLNLSSELIEKNHNPIIINESNYSNINYNYRLFIINDIKYLTKFNKNYYNLIIIY